MNKEIKDTDFEMVGENKSGNQSKSGKPWWKTALKWAGLMGVSAASGYAGYKYGEKKGYKAHDNMCRESGIYDAANRQREYERRKGGI